MREIATVGKLAGGSVRLTPEAPTARFPVMFPAGAKQGDGGWYALRVHYRLTFEKDTGTGFAWLGSATNGNAAMLNEYELTRDSAGRLHVERTTLNVYRSTHRSGSFLTDRVVFWNLLQTRGVRPGRSSWSFGLEQTDDVRVAAVTILPRSRLEVSDRDPYPLKLAARVVTAPVEVGTPERIRVTLRAAKPGVRKVQLYTQQVDSNLAVESSRSWQHIGRVAKKRVVDIPFTVNAEGRYQVVVRSRSTANHPLADVLFDTANYQPPQASGVAPGCELPLCPVRGRHNWLR